MFFSTFEEINNYNGESDLILHVVITFKEKKLKLL